MFHNFDCEPTFYEIGREIGWGGREKTHQETDDKAVYL